MGPLGKSRREEAGRKKKTRGQGASGTAPKSEDEGGSAASRFDVDRGRTGRATS